MATISQSAFLQALGWATLNSFWQIGLLWCLFLVADFLFRFSSRKKYLFSIAAVGLGFAWFVGSFFYYLDHTEATGFRFINLANPAVEGWLPVILTSASATYLLLLLVPTYRLYQNWRFIRTIRRQGLKKVPVTYRLYVQRIAGLMGIKKPVHVYLSEIVTSPVTIGYLKPIILLPVASLNQLTLQQAEAVLLHELSHIRRYDYLVNIFLSIIHTLLYFNPFVKLFIRTAEAAREECCDEMVLQFGYDKVSYATALLSLEKASAATQIFALGAAGKKHLLQRIEKIVGMPGKKPVLNFNHFTGLIAALLCIFALHSFFVTSQFKMEGPLSLGNFGNPFYIVSNGIDETETPNTTGPKNIRTEVKTEIVVLAAAPRTTAANAEGFVSGPFAEVVPPPAEVPDAPIIPVAFHTTEANLNAEQEQQVEATVNATKKVLTTLEWKEMEKEIADGLTEQEKQIARQQYLKEVEQINWENVENNLKVNYDEVNWEKINSYLDQAMTSIKLDSLEKTYAVILNKLEKSECQVKAKALPFPDCSVQQIQRQKMELKKTVDSLKAIREKKVIRL